MARTSALLPTLLLSLLLGSLAAPGCGTSQAKGAGLVLLPGDEPLPAGVLQRDPRLNFHDFGHVPDGDVVSHVFRMQNGDPGPVTIQRVVPGCGCTVASLRYTSADGTIIPGQSIGSKSQKLLVIPPGVVAELELKIDTRQLATKNVDKLIITNVTSDSPNGYYLSFEVHILVEKAFEITPGMIQLGRVPKNAGADGALDIVPARGFTLEVDRIQEFSPGVHAELAREERLGTPLWTLHAGFDAPLALGLHQAKVVLATRTATGEAGRPLEVALVAQVVDDLAADPERIVFSAPRAERANGQAQVFSLLAGQRLKVLGVELPEAQRELFEVSCGPQEPDPEGKSLRWTVSLTTRPPLPPDAVLSGKLLLRLDDPQHERFELPYVVHLK